MTRQIARWVAIPLLAGFLICVAGCEGDPPEAVEKFTADSTVRMAARLQRVLGEIGPEQIDFGANDRRVEMLRHQLTLVTEWKMKMPMEFLLAKELLADGRNTEMLACLDGIEQSMAERGVAFTPVERRAVRMLRVQAQMRIGETDNCCSEHNVDSCLVPLQGDAIYRHPDGPRKAIALLEDQLADVPGDLTARWLMNIAHMTLGDYPESVPPQWRIDPKVFASDYDLKRFIDVAPGAGLDTFGLSGGCVVSDFDGDGFLDIVRSDFGLNTQMRFFHNNGDGTFSDHTAAAGLTGEVGGLNMISADYDNDGNADILVLRGGWLGKAGRFPKSLLRNNGDGTFTDTTEQAGLLVAHPTQTAAWLDYDGDGWLDLFVGNETTDPNDIHRCELFHNNRNGTFTECAEASGVQVIDFVKGVASGDYNNDGRPDLYVSQRRGGSNLLLRNDGPRDPANPNAGWKFTNVTKAAGLADPIMSFPCWFFDYDNDGWQDIFVCGFAGKVQAVVAEFLEQPSTGERPRLYRNNRDGTFTDVAPTSGLDMTVLGMSGNYGDLDNDGFLDFLIGTGEPAYTALVPNRMFRNAGGRHFQDVTTSGGFGSLQKGHGIAFADINNDGQQDIYAVLGGAFTGDKYYTALYANPGHYHNHWVKFELEGVESNRSALGARIRVIAATAAGDRSIHRTVSTGGSFGASPLAVHVGLGDAKSIKSIEIYWPKTGRTQRIPGMPMERSYKIREGDAKAVPWEARTFKFLNGNS